MLDFLSRTSGSGVISYQGFERAQEVDQFRWTSSYGGGNNPLAAAGGGTMRWIGTDGPLGGCMEVVIGAGTTGQDNLWWWPWAPKNTGSGKLVNDPAANGTMTVRSWTSTDGGSQTSNFANCWVGHPTYQSADPTHIELNDIYIQLQVKMDPARITGGNQANTVGKFVWFSVAEGGGSLVGQEHVIWSYGDGGNNGTKNYVRVYVRNTTGLSTSEALNDADPSGRIQPNSDDTVDWSYSGGWDTLEFHLRPGLLNTTTGADASLLEIWAAHPGEFTPKRIWNQQYGISGYDVRNALQCVILTGYNNGASFPQQFYHRYGPIITSKNFIPFPQVTL